MSPPKPTVLWRDEVVGSFTANTIDSLSNRLQIELPWYFDSDEWIVGFAILDDSDQGYAMIQVTRLDGRPGLAFELISNIKTADISTWRAEIDRIKSVGIPLLNHNSLDIDIVRGDVAHERIEGLIPPLGISEIDAGYVATDDADEQWRDLLSAPYVPNPPPVGKRSNRPATSRAEQQTQIISGLAEIIEEVTGIEPSEVTPEKSFVDDLDIDSLSMVEIAVQTEDKYGVKIPDEDLAGLRTVGDVVSYIQKLEEENPEAAAALRDKFAN